MNFFGHAVVAGWTDMRAQHVLGSMLPDFETMAGASLLEVRDPDVQRGIDFHHRTDDAFHRTSIFLSLSARALEVLTESGVRRGTARAVGHIATEMFLDGWLTEEPNHVAGYLGALRLEPGGELRWTDGGLAFAKLQARLAAWGAPHDYQAPSFVFARLCDALRRRPALAILDEEAGRVAACLPALQARVRGHARELLEELRDALGFDH